ncbi:MAG: chorismate synthase [Verrucomicrobia bacterium]|nr:chorismate synthase [Verrucomicrobiota bacterium]
MSSFLGTLFRVATWGESHGPGVGAVVDGCPPGLELDASEIQRELDRRRPGQSALVSPRREADRVEILSGVFEGRTTGAPIALWTRNADARPEAYAEMADKFRPSHADYTYYAKYGIRDWRGGGRSSARETIGRVAAGAVAKKLLRARWGVEILAYVLRVKEVEARVDPEAVSLSQVESNPVRCPDAEAAEAMRRTIEEARKAGDTVGGAIECAARGAPPGWGEPAFDRLEADLAKATLSIPASKGFEIGSGFAGTRMSGSEHNDLFYAEKGRVRTRTNRSGGVQGGVSNGELILFRVAFKPVATIMRPQETVDIHLQPAVLQGRGRHDPCVLPRAVPIVEAMAALTLADHALRQEALRAGAFPDRAGGV